MPTSMRQVEDTERGKTLLHVEGNLLKDDAVLLEKIVHDMREQLNKNITIDLADLAFLDSESAPILKRIEREHGFELEGLEVFLQKDVAESEK